MLVGHTTFKTLMSKLYRDLGVNVEINEAHVVEWIAEVLEKIGSYYQYVEEKVCLDLTDGKALLPCNFFRIKDIAYKNTALAWASPSLLTQYGCEDSNIPTCCTNNSFYISGNYIITDITTSTGVNATVDESPQINVVYLGVPVDDDGYPLIPDDVYFLEACAKYVTYMLDYKEWRKGNVADKVLLRSETDYLFYVNSARGSANMPSAGQLENLKNVWVRLIPKQNEYNSFFSNNSKQEKRFKY